MLKILAFLLLLPTAGRCAGAEMIDFGEERASGVSPAQIHALRADAAASSAITATAASMVLPARWQALYLEAEGAGTVGMPGQVISDGQIVVASEDNQMLAPGQEVPVKLKAAGQAGQVYLIFHDAGPIAPAGVLPEIGPHLIQASGLLKLTGQDHGVWLGRITTSFGTIAPGDGLSLRSKVAAAWRESLKPQPGVKIPRGSVVAVKDRSLAGAGDVVYLSLGHQDGLVPGTLLRIRKNPKSTDSATDDPATPVGPVGQVKVLGTTAHSSSAKVLRTSSLVEAGDSAEP
jgi:hypothetical protein